MHRSSRPPRRAEDLHNKKQQSNAKEVPRDVKTVFRENTDKEIHTFPPSTSLSKPAEIRIEKNSRNQKQMPVKASSLCRQRPHH